MTPLQYADFKRYVLRRLARDPDAFVPDLIKFELLSSGIRITVRSGENRADQIFSGLTSESTRLDVALTAHAAVSYLMVDLTKPVD